ncbi:MAG: hypothetical protein BMS9Abin07_1364 [Acidimicrobiia bacterium]|nr:MAG: hypothetical protein BMS9Abin07_1364 [Acidimicrobiia bacterium]
MLYLPATDSLRPVIGRRGIPKAPAARGADPIEQAEFILRKRIPFLFAALLVAGLVAVVGAAALSISGSEAPPEEQSFDITISGRVGSAILAASVSTPQQEPVPTTEVEASVPQLAEAAEAPSTTAGPSTTTAPTTAAPDTTPPALVVASPDDGATVSSSVVEFTGTSEAGASVASGPFAATMDDDGTWTIRLVVSSGYNSTVFTASDAAGNEASVRLVVYYEPPATTTTTHAHQGSTTPTTHAHPPSTTTTTKPSTTTTTKPPSNCPVTGACSPKWPADSAGGRSREAWRSVVAQYWQADRVECVLDLIQWESNGDPQAFSGYYLGLLQHSPWAWNKRAAAAGFKDGNGLTAHPYNGAANIAAGAWLADNSSPWWRPWPPAKSIASCQALGAK